MLCPSGHATRRRWRAYALGAYAIMVLDSRTATAGSQDVTFGSDVNGPSAAMGTCFGNSGFACVVVPTSLPTAQTTSPCDGTITRFRINGAPSTNSYRLRVVQIAGNTATVVSSSGVVSLAVDGVNTFDASLPINAGDYLGLDFNQSTENFKVRYRQPGTDLLFKNGIPESGSVNATGTDSFLEYLFNVDVACTQTSTTSTPVSTSSTTTLGGGCGVPTPTFTSIRCRVGALRERVRGESGLGSFQAKLAKSLDTASSHATEAESSCAGGDPKKAKKRLQQLKKDLTKYAHRLRGLAARKKLDSALRESFLAAGDAITPDVVSLRGSLQCSPS